MLTVPITKQPVFADEPDLYTVLGVLPDATSEEADAAYKRQSYCQPQLDPIIFTAWKVLRSTVYSRIYRRTRSLFSLYEAGFIVDSIQPEQMHLLHVSKGFLTTPLDKVIANCIKSSSRAHLPPTVLVTTGGFSPIHFGHIAMMESAKSALEARGVRVVGGFFAISHDAYVGTKYQGDATLTKDHRIYLARLAVAESSWLAVDPWKSRYLPTFINFTDVVERLKSYLDLHIKSEPPFQVLYVFGSDNARYCGAFHDYFGCVCVGRTSSEMLFEKYRNPRSIFVRHEQPEFAAVSSSKVRAGQSSLWPNEVAETYTSWKTEALRRQEGPHEICDYWLIHAEVDNSLIAPENGTQLDSFIELESSVRAALVRAFANVSFPDYPRDLNFHEIKHGGRWLQSDPRPLINKKCILRLDQLLFGSFDGGIIIALPDGSSGAMPALEPYASLSAIAGVPPSSEVQLSIDLWELLAIYYCSLQGTRIVNDLPSTWERALVWLGFTRDTSLADVCRWHSNRLRGLSDMAGPSSKAN